MRKSPFHNRSWLGLPIILLAVSGCMVNLCCDNPQQKYHRTVEISAPMMPAGSLHARTSNGNITITGTTQNLCTLKADITAKAPTIEEAKAIAEQVNITLLDQGGITTVNVEKPDSPLSKHIGISFEITTPTQTSPALQSSNGNISIMQITGTVKAETSNGSVSSHDVSGPAELRTSNGNIVCKSLLHDLKAKTSNGGVTVVCAPDAAPSNISAETSNGSIRFTAPADFSATVHASTSNGSVTTALPITVKGQMKKNRIEGSIGTGQGTLHLHSSNGSIRIDGP